MRIMVYLTAQIQYICKCKQVGLISFETRSNIPELRTHMRDIYEEEYLVFNVQCFANDVTSANIVK